MAVNDTIQLAVRGTVRGQQHVHTLHFRDLNVGTVNPEQGLIDSWQAVARTTYRSCFAEADSPVLEIEARQVCGTLPLRAPVIESEAAGNQPGTAAASGVTLGEALPSAACTVVTLRTAFAGRSRRGRFFLGGLYEGEQAAGVLGAGYKGLVQGYVDALLAAYTSATDTPANGLLLVVHSRHLSTPGVQCQNSSTPVRSALVRDEVHWLRSRMPGHGN